MMRLRAVPCLCWLLALCLGLGSFPWAGLAWTQEEPDQRLETVKEQFQDGEFEAAVASLRQILDSPVEGATRRDALLYLGFCELELGNSEQATAAFKEVLALSPDYRLDPAEFPPRLRSAFEEARAALYADTGVDVVTLLEPRGKLSKPSKIPSAFAAKWYKKWWLWAGVGAVAVGVAVIVGSGGGDGYVPPILALSIVTDECGEPNPPNSFEPGDIVVEADVSRGEPPYTLSFSLNGAVVDTRTATTASLVSFTYEGLESSPGGGCLSTSLSASVVDAQNNQGEVVSEQRFILVCRCF